MRTFVAVALVVAFLSASSAFADSNGFHRLWVEDLYQGGSVTVESSEIRLYTNVEQPTIFAGDNPSILARFHRAGYDYDKDRTLATTVNIKDHYTEPVSACADSTVEDARRLYVYVFPNPYHRDLNQVIADVAPVGLNVRPGYIVQIGGLTWSIVLFDPWPARREL